MDFEHALSFLPFLIAVFTAIAITLVCSWVILLQSASGFMIFFLLLAFSRLFSKSLKDSIESPSFKVIYQTIDEKIRYEVQSAMDGTINEIAALSSGLLLAGLGIISFIKLIHFSWVLFLHHFMWMFFAFRLYTEYRKSIRKSLETVDNKGSGTGILTEKDIFKSRFSASRTFKTDYFNLITGDYSELENNKNKWYLKKIIDYSDSKHDINLIPVLKKIASSTAIDDEIRRQSVELVQNIEQLSVSGKLEDEKIISARKILSGARSPQTTEILRLLRDNSIESKRLAIFMIGKFKLPDMLPEVCECLNIPSLETDAYTVLQTFGGSTVDELIRFYLASSGNITTSKSILRLLGKTRTKEGIDISVFPAVVKFKTAERGCT